MSDDEVQKDIEEIWEGDGRRSSSTKEEIDKAVKAIEEGKQKR